MTLKEIYELDLSHLSKLIISRYLRDCSTEIYALNAVVSRFTRMLKDIENYSPSDSEEDYWMRAQDGNRNSDYCRGDERPSQPLTQRGEGEYDMILRLAKSRLAKLQSEEQ